jgi:uncharacterized membrane protein YkvA (DUF1232 family)
MGKQSHEANPDRPAAPAQQRAPGITWRALLRELPSLFKLVFRLMRDPAVATPGQGAVRRRRVYMLTPIDLIPDFLGVVGWVDDFYLLGLALGRLMCPPGPTACSQHWDGDPKALGYLVEGVEELGGMLPPASSAAARHRPQPGQLRPEGAAAARGPPHPRRRGRSRPPRGIARSRA